MKKTSFARDLFSHTDWLPHGFFDRPVDQVTELGSDLVTQIQKTPETLSKQEALGSMKNFTDKVLEKNQVEKVVLDNVEVSREKSQSNYILESHQAQISWDILEANWSDQPIRLADLKSKKDVQILFLVHNFLESDSDDPLSFVFAKDQLDLFVKMAGAMKIPAHQIAVSAVSADSNKSLNWSHEEALKNLHHEINVLNPKYIVSFGAMATHAILQKKVRLSLVQGEFFNYTLGFSQGSRADKLFKVMPLFHPEYLLINPNMKRKTWEGMKKIMESL